jgi:hypothetical protein
MIKYQYNIPSELGLDAFEEESALPDYIVIIIRAREACEGTKGTHINILIGTPRVS